MQEFAVFGEHLFAMPGQKRALGLNPLAIPQCGTTPGQVVYSPNGSQLIVTTKASGDNIDVFSVGRLGALAANPVVNADTGAVPFAITFDSSNNLVIAAAGIKALSTCTLNSDNSITRLSSVPTGYAATCWVAPRMVTSMRQKPIAATSARF